MSGAYEMRMAEEAAEAERGGALRPTLASLPSRLDQSTEFVAEMLGLPRELVRIHLQGLVRRASRKGGHCPPQATVVRK